MCFLPHRGLSSIITRGGHENDSSRQLLLTVWGLKANSTLLGKQGWWWPLLPKVRALKKCLPARVLGGSVQVAGQIILPSFVFSLLFPHGNDAILSQRGDFAYRDYSPWSEQRPALLFQVIPQYSASYSWLNRVLCSRWERLYQLMKKSKPAGALCGWMEHFPAGQYSPGDSSSLQIPFNCILILEIQMTAYSLTACWEDWLLC